MSVDIPQIDKNLSKRIKIVRRDIGDLLFHFTRTFDEDIGTQVGYKGKSALDVLKKILEEGRLLGSSKWIKDKSKCICFTEAPIHEFAAIFSLVKMAADKKERPRYEPYGVAVKKEWLYNKGGRPVIYDSEELYEKLPKDLKYRYVPFDPQKGIDCTWEREWRIRCDELLLDPKNTLIVVPDAETAFDIAYSYSEEYLSSETSAYKEADGQVGGQSKVLTRKPTWMTVSLDLFDIKVE
jgi:hypothetical protein